MQCVQYMQVLNFACECFLSVLGMGAAELCSRVNKSSGATPAELGMLALCYTLAQALSKTISAKLLALV